MNKAQKPTTLISLGNEFRGDDGAGLLVQKQLKENYPDLYYYQHHNGDPSSLINLWNKKNIIIVDAIDAENLKIGTILNFDPYDNDSVSWESRASSSHALSLDTAIKLSMELDYRPAKILVYGIVGKIFSIGSPLSPEVAGACYKLKNLLVEKSKEL